MRPSGAQNDRCESQGSRGALERKRGGDLAERNQPGSRERVPKLAHPANQREAPDCGRWESGVREWDRPGKRVWWRCRALRSKARRTKGTGEGSSWDSYAFLWKTKGTMEVRDRNQKMSMGVPRERPRGN